MAIGAVHRKRIDKRKQQEDKRRELKEQMQAE